MVKYTSISQKSRIVFACNVELDYICIVNITNL